MPYTLKDAEREVGDSKDWLVGLEASIKKWEQRVRGDIVSYGRADNCGLCFVADNRGLACPNCPAYSLCQLSSYQNDEEMLLGLKKLRKEVNQMDCSNCTNYEPRCKPPFPEGLRTADLAIGMLAQRHNARYGPGPFLAITATPTAEKVKVVNITKGYRPRDDEIYLSDAGCQPYASGKWNDVNWLKEVK